MAALGMSAFEACGYSLITKPTVSLPHVLGHANCLRAIRCGEMLIVLTDMSVLSRTWQCRTRDRDITQLGH